MIKENRATTLSLDKVLHEIRKLPSLPALMAEIMASINNDRIDIAALVEKISQDQALVARLMRVANSPFFGLSGQIGSIGQAITVLGFSSLRGLVTAAGLINAFPRIPGNFDQPGFWRHSVGTSICAKVLAKRSGLNPETAFTAGLLHDIGKLVMVVYFPDGFKGVEKIGNGRPGLIGGGACGFRNGSCAARRKSCRTLEFSLGNQPCRERTSQSAESRGANEPGGCGLRRQRIGPRHGALDDDAGYVAAEAWARFGLDSETLNILAEETERLQSGAFMLIGE